MLTNSWHLRHDEAWLYHQELLREAAQRRLAGPWQTRSFGSLRALICAVWRGVVRLQRQ